MARLAPALLATLLGLALGCDDTPTIKIFPAPDREDMVVAADQGVDMSTPQADMRDPLACTGQLEGERCPLNHASGACVLGRCQLIACEFGWLDCDGRAETGCERDTTQPSACGSCERACRAEERCALGERAWVCTSGTICPVGRFDVDRAAANGCEWQLGAGAGTGLLAGADAQAAALSDGSAWVATGERERLVGWSGAPEAEGVALLDAAGDPLVAAPPLQIAARGAQALVAWGDRATLHAGDATGVMTVGHFESACGAVHGVSWLDNASDAIGLLVGSTLMTVGQSEVGASCAQPGGCLVDAATFGPADYLRAFYPYPSRGLFEEPALVADAAWSLEAGEVASCTPCLLDLDRAAFVRDASCWGSGQCAAQPAAACEACDASIILCPSYAPVRLLPLSGERALVVTERGVIALQRVAAGWRPRGRMEERYLPGSVGGGRVLDAAVHERADGSARVFLWHSGGFVRAIDIRWSQVGEPTLRPAWADVGVAASTIDARPARIAAWGAERAVVIDDARVWLIGYTERGASIHSIQASDLASVAQLLAAQLAADGGLWLAGARFGLLTLWPLRAE
jgi:hypothetical protein